MLIDTHGNTDTRGRPFTVLKAELDASCGCRGASTYAPLMAYDMTQHKLGYSVAEYRGIDVVVKIHEHTNDSSPTWLDDAK